MSTTYLFHLDINSVDTGKVDTKLCRRRSYSKVDHRKVYKVLVGVRTHITVIFQWTEKIFESEGNVPHLVHRWRPELLQYQFVIWHRPERMIWECDMLPR